ncbi:MAG: AAA family ATPase [Azospirillaceae bacterium]
MTDETDQQKAVIGFLRNPASHGGAEVEEVVTHASHLFMAGDRVYKLKRAVHYPFLDYSTVQKRRVACEREVSLNRRTAPSLYLEVASIGGDDGRLGWGGDPVRDHVVVMNRFDQDGLFDRRAEAGTLDAADLEGLADSVRRFHGGLPAIEPVPDWPASFGWVIDDNREELHELASWRRRDLAGFDRWTAGARAAGGPLLAERSAAVRLCHGDLHLRNVVMLDGRPTPFDGIEFDDTIATIDPLYDIAFLMMDLAHRRLDGHASRFLSRYLFPATGEAWRDEPSLWRGLALLDLYLTQRASVRAKTALAGGDGDDPEHRREADGYLDLALAIADRAPPVLVAVGGLSGTGKTTLAHALLEEPALPAGTVHLRSDVIRKRLFGAGDDDRLPEEAYAPEVGRHVFALMGELAGRVLGAGRPVVVDGVYAQAEERQAIAAMARERGADFRPLWLDGPESLRLERVGGRRGDASDADAAVVRRQSDYDLGRLDWPRIAADGPIAAVRARAVEALGFS